MEAACASISIDLLSYYDLLTLPSLMRMMCCLSWPAWELSLLSPFNLSSG